MKCDKWPIKIGNQTYLVDLAYPPELGLPSVFKAVGDGKFQLDGGNIPHTAADITSGMNPEDDQVFIIARLKGK